MSDTTPLAGKVAIVAGATRGAGRAIAVELARPGACVYATGRSSRSTGRSEIGRPETIEDTGDLITDAGGKGIALVVDHEDPDAVRRLVARVEEETGRLDVLVTDETSTVNARYRDGVGFYYDLVKAGVGRIVTNLTAELADHPVTALGVTPGWLRSEQMLENFGVTEATWRDACVKQPGFAISESPAYVARGIAALAADDRAGRFAGQVLSSRHLADAYGVTDTDGSQPDCWGMIEEHGMGGAGPDTIESFRGRGPVTDGQAPVRCA
jgi:NAD(P)-dependent dehydrogenase (short-subunit alcohol dehydrogenase family)